ncbi:MAG TPA: tetratricopeptide repeat protein [bacterium]|nr:tetratricopeptide repeat protein [bacterium]
MIEMDRSHLAVIMEAGYVYLGMRRFKEARELFEGLEALAPDSEVPLVALGNVDFCTGKLSKAIRRYEQALKLDSKSAFAKVYLGEALFFAGREDEAKDLLRDVSRSDKGGAGDFAKALMEAIRKGLIAPQKGRSKK